MSKVKFKYQPNDLIMYLALIPFLLPLGFEIYFPQYKTFCDMWLALSSCYIFVLFLFKNIKQRVKYKNCIWIMLIYFIVLTLITLYIQNGINEGIKKIFFSPILCVFCSIYLQSIKKSRVFIKSIANILTVIFVLNLTIFSEYLCPQYFNSQYIHIIFLGHVQVVSQFGLIGLLVGYLLYRMGDSKQAILLIILSILTMLLSRTSASYVVIGTFLFFYFIKKLFPKEKLLSSKIFVIFFAVVNIFILFFNSYYANTSFMNYFVKLSSGRTFIWNEGINLLKGHWLIGYGAYGIKIKVFWNQWINREGMNYAHNTFLQNLLDGGLVLVVLFFIMFWMYISNIEKISDEKTKYFSKTILVAILIIMTFESMGEYFYYYIILSILAYLPELSKFYVVKEDEVR